MHSMDLARQHAHEAAKTILGLTAGVFAALLVLVLVVLVLGIVMVVQSHRRGRSWWVYLICLFISPVNLIAIIAWFGWLRKKPITMGPVTL